MTALQLTSTYIAAEVIRNYCGPKLSGQTVQTYYDRTKGTKMTDRPIGRRSPSPVSDHSEAESSSPKKRQKAAASTSQRDVASSAPKAKSTDLPDELVVSIIKEAKLSPLQTLALAKTNRQFARMSQDKEVWQGHVAPKVPTQDTEPGGLSEVLNMPAPQKEMMRQLWALRAEATFLPTGLQKRIELEYNDNRQIAFAGVTLSGEVFPALSDRLKDDEAVLTAAMKTFPRAFKSASERLRSDPKIAEIAIATDCRNYDKIGPSLQNDPHLSKLALKTLIASSRDSDGLNAVMANPAVWAHHKEIIELLHMEPEAFEFAPSHGISNFQVMEALVRVEGFCLQMFGHPSLVIDADRAKRLMTLNPTVMEGLANFRNDLNFAKSFITSAPEWIQFAGPQVRDDKIVILASLRHAGTNLQHASLRLQAEWDVVEEAVHNDVAALAYASSAITSDASKMILAAQIAPRAIVYADPSLFADSETRDKLLAPVVATWSQWRMHAPAYPDIMQHLVPSLSEEEFRNFFIDPVSNHAGCMLAFVKRDPSYINHASYGLSNDWTFLKSCLQTDIKCLDHLPLQLLQSESFVTSFAADFPASASLLQESVAKKVGAGA